MALLREIGAPPLLYRHAELVGQAADLLLAGLKRFGVQVDEEYVRVGAALHDAGKTLHRSELIGPGSNHEPDGERLLLSHGATPGVARVCRSHAPWDTVPETVEELLIALRSAALAPIAAPWLGYITHYEKKSNCLVVMGHWHSARRNELDWRR